MTQPTPIKASQQSLRLGSAFLLSCALLGAPILAQPGLLYDNGPVSNSVGTGFGGADESILDTNLDDDLGFPNGPVPFDNRVADDFTVPGPDAWTLNVVVLFGYQDLSPAPDRGVDSTLTGFDLRIWNGRPGDMGSTVVYSTSGLDSSLFSDIYRVTIGTPGANNRPIMENRVPVSVALPPGTYWLDWQTTGTLADGGPFVPPIPTTVFRGVAGTTGNAVRFSANTGWVNLVDTSSNNAKGLPFRLEGAVGAVSAIPTAAGWAMVLLGLSLAVLTLTKLKP